ncbi:MAG TPA: hypothetical protein VHZ55_28740 [Bryobacteraceae bacterium]|nr:hypothetical protein [Bryobacteraceae bacterium]
MAILVACGLRRHEAVELNVSHLQQREEHWAIIDMIGQGLMYSDHSDSRLGQGSGGRLVTLGRDHKREDL